MKSSSHKLLFLELCVASHVFYYNFLFLFLSTYTHFFFFTFSPPRNDSLVLTVGVHPGLLVFQFYLQSVSYPFLSRIWLVSSWEFSWFLVFIVNISYVFFDFLWMYRPPSGASVKPLQPQSPTRAPQLPVNKTASVSTISSMCSKPAQTVITQFISSLLYRWNLPCNDFAFQIFKVFAPRDIARPDKVLPLSQHL